MIENYEKYLNVIQEKLNTFFERQKDYIFCKSGCAKCCNNAQFPFTEIEFKYLMSGFEKLPEETQGIIMGNVEKILEQKTLHTDKSKVFRYTCPFLINNLCSNYQYRGIICRTFGLMSQSASDKRLQMPFCISENLNYSNVYDKEKQLMTIEKYEQTGFKNPPTAFNIDYETLCDSEFEKGFNFTFGEVKPLIDWFDKV